MLRFCSKFAQSACRTVFAGVSTAGRSYVGAAYAQATAMPSPTNSRVAAAAGIAAASAVTIFGRFLILLLWLGMCSRPACGISSPEARPQQASEREPVCPGLMGAATASTLPMERSFIMIKPDGVQRGLVSEIVGRFESRGYKLVGMKLMTPSTELAGKHYAEHDGRPFYPKLVDFLSSGPVVAMVWEGKDVIKTGRAMIGTTNPLASSPGTIRGDLGIDVGRNIIHGSDSVESAQREIALWFSPDELANYQVLTHSMIYE